MNARIKNLTDTVLKQTIYPKAKEIEYDKFDLFLPDVLINTKRLCDYMLAQDVKIADGALFAGQIRFDKCPYPSNLFPRTGHKRFNEVCEKFYNTPMNNFATFEWQHSTPNYADVMVNGIEGIISRIEKSLENHKGEAEKEEFLNACKMMCEGIMAWEDKCSDECAKLAASEADLTRKNQLIKMSNTLKNVPRKPASSFYESVQSLYFCFDFLSDSIGTIDRYLYKYYKHDIENNIITRDEAKEFLQELFIRIQSYTDVNSDRFYRGGECHFAIGGYNKDGEDGYNELSELIVEALMDLPLYIPQISLRWTKKTPFEVLKRLMNYERNDPHKRIAFVSDEPRIKSFMQNVGLSYEEAINYTMVGCNEPALQGGIWFGGLTINIVRSLTNTFIKHKESILNCKTFDEFYNIYKIELDNDLAEILSWSDKFNYARSKDTNVLSSLFLKGCIENGVSVTKGGAMGISGANLMGITNIIDSLTVIKQFVFEEKLCSMADIINAIENNWKDYEDLHTLILKKAKFFGNNYELSDEIARKFTSDIYAFLNGKTNIFGKHFLVGNLTGYNQHYAWFGEKTPATPDGRYDGEQLSLGIGQTGGKDREGLSSLLASVAKFDPKGIFCGPCVTNINLDSALIYNDDNFEKTVKMIETYFKSGGLHVQINTVKHEDLLNAQKAPVKYKSLRVRVSGFSDFFVNLNDDLQENVIERTKIES